MARKISFADYSIVACGTMIPELNVLKETGFLDTQILYTAPGLHQDPNELERQLSKQLEKAKKLTKKIIVVYGGKYCYINMRDSYRTIDAIIEEMREDGYYIARTEVENCLDMVASVEHRAELAEGKKFGFVRPVG